jgi:hypothetical protein
VAQIFTSICIIVPVCASFTTIFAAYFPVTTFRLRLVSGVYIAAENIILFFKADNITVSKMHESPRES